MLSVLRHTRSSFDSRMGSLFTFFFIQRFFRHFFFFQRELLILLFLVQTFGESQGLKFFLLEDKVLNISFSSF